MTQEKIKGDYFANVKDKLRQFDTFLGDKPWFAGDGVSLYIAILFWFKKSRDIADSLKIVSYYRSQFKWVLKIELHVLWRASSSRDRVFYILFSLNNFMIYP